MQFSLLAVCILLRAQMAAAIPATADIHYHEQQAQHLPASMWTFSDRGVVIFTADGQEELKRHSAADLRCGEECFYFDVVSDGRKYVWGNALHANPNRIDAFSLETGDYLGGVAVCSTPIDMDYILNREELWIRCAGDESSANTTSSGHLKVIHTNSLGMASDDVRLNNERSYGHAAFHSTMGNFGYATGNTHNLLWKVDLSVRQAVANFTLENAHSAYEMTYSPFNRHVFLRSRVCCTCGFEGADAPTCGRFPGTPGQNILTGPSAGRSELNGTCGVGCEGSVADTIGIMEFDTVSETFVANHQPSEGFGASAEASPDGQHIVLFPNDGGKSIRVLQAGENGQASTVAFDIPVNFENVPPGQISVSDFAFIERNGRNLLALASAYDNNLVLADLSVNPPTVTKVLLSTSDSPTGGSGERMVEWAYGTDYLWVDGSAEEELYVLKLDGNGGASVERTITSVPSSKMIYVENFAKRAMQNMISNYVSTALTKSNNGDPSSSSSSGVSNVDESDILLQRMQEAGLLADDDEKASVVAIIALVIGCLSLLMNVMIVMNYFLTASSKGGVKNIDDKNKGDERAKSSDIPDDSKTLGSKLVA